MLHILTIVAPAFIIIFLGLGLTKIGYFKKSWGDGLSAFVHRISVPALMFTVTATADIRTIFNVKLLISFYSGAISNFIFIILILRYLLKKQMDSSIIHGFGASFSNAVLLGIPLAIAIFGVEGSSPIYSIISLHSPIMFSLLAIFIGWTRPTTSFIQKIKVVFLDLGRNPIIISLILGITCNILRVPLPETFIAFLRRIASISSIAALFAIGSTLTGFSLHKDVFTSSILVFFKLILFPAIVFGVAVKLFGLPLEIAKIAIFISALPSGVNGYIMAHYYGKGMEVNSATILLSTTLSIVSITGWLYLIGV